ncbi:hypothetical protein WMI_00169 [Enterococcus faecalis EnGen0363]|nr:hypothetical protein [Enterococcus faecalis]EOJ58620.1 hypothetical protein WMI_00169 [Enterococcus faecalis EnGen0363]
MTSKRSPITTLPFRRWVSYEGIGIKLSSDIIAIDLDHCVNQGKLNSTAQKIVKHFPTSHIEISPSGTGLRIAILASTKIIFNPAIHHVKKGDVEFYTANTNKFVTLTGNVYQQGDVVENNEGTNWLIENYLMCKLPKSSPVSISHRPSLLTDDEVFLKAKQTWLCVQYWDFTVMETQRRLTVYFVSQACSVKSGTHFVVVILMTSLPF